MPRFNEKGLPILLDRTLSRRSLLDWMGRGTVLALGGELINACSPEDDQSMDYDGGSDGGSAWAGNGTDAGAGQNECSGSGSGFSFSPGSTQSDIYSEWPALTVDPQDLSEILASWKLTIDGMVESQATLTFADILKLPRQDQVTDLHCGEGWSVYDIPWNGVHLSSIFDLVKPFTGAAYVVFHTLGDVYDESIPVDVAGEEKTILAYGVDCSTLPLEHGFPLRLVVPRKWGYKSAKYIYRIEFSDEPLLGYWTRNGFPYDADVPDERLRPGKY